MTKSASLVVPIVLATLAGCGGSSHGAGATEIFRAADPLTPLGKSLYFKVEADSQGLADAVAQVGFSGARLLAAPAVHGEQRCSFTREIRKTTEPAILRTWAGENVTVSIYSTLPKSQFWPSCQSLEGF